MPINQVKGFSMIEVLVTIAITTIGLLGISAMQLKANQASQDSGNRSQAVWMLKDLSDRMNANSNGLAFYDTGGNYNCANPPRMCAAYYDGGGKDPDDCTNQEMAQFDLWDVACSRDYTLDGVNVREKAAEFISNHVLNISVDVPTNSATLSMTWDVRTSGTNASGDKLYIIDEDAENRTDTLVRQVQL